MNGHVPAISQHATRTPLAQVQRTRDAFGPVGALSVDIERSPAVQPTAVPCPKSKARASGQRRHPKCGLAQRFNFGRRGRTSIQKEPVNQRNEAWQQADFAQLSNFGRQGQTTSILPQAFHCADMDEIYLPDWESRTHVL